MGILDRYTNTILGIDKKIKVNSYTELMAYRTEEGEERYTITISMSSPHFYHESSFLSRIAFKEYLVFLIIHDVSDTRSFHELVVGSCPEIQILLGGLASSKQINNKVMKEALKRDHPSLVQRVNRYSTESMFDAVIEVMQHTFQKYSGQTDYHSQTCSRVTLRANSQEAAELRYENNAFQYFERNWGGPDDTINFKTNAEVRNFLTRRSYLSIIDGRLVGVVAQELHYILEREYGIQTIREYLDLKSEVQ